MIKRTCFLILVTLLAPPLISIASAERLHWVCSAMLKDGTSAKRKGRALAPIFYTDNFDSDKKARKEMVVYWKRAIAYHFKAEWMPSRSWCTPKVDKKIALKMFYEKKGVIDSMKYGFLVKFDGR